MDSTSGGRSVNNHVTDFLRREEEQFLDLGDSLESTSLNDNNNLHNEHDVVGETMNPLSSRISSRSSYQGGRTDATGGGGDNDDESQHVEDDDGQERKTSNGETSFVPEMSFYQPYDTQDYRLATEEDYHRVGDVNRRYMMYPEDGQETYGPSEDDIIGEPRDGSNAPQQPYDVFAPDRRHSTTETFYPSKPMSPSIGSRQPSVSTPTPMMTTTTATTNEDLYTESPMIVEWRERQRRLIEEKDMRSTRKKSEVLDEGQKALEKFYEEYNYRKTKNMTLNQERESMLQRERDEPSVKGKEWDRICRYIDLNVKNTRSTKDMSRMRSLLLDLRREEP
jgi:hypothetical protein